MSKLVVPEGYSSALSVYETQSAIGELKRRFEENLADALCLRRVSAPLFVDADSGLNDNLNGVERPVRFDIAETHKTAEIVHSLAKWKRFALGAYGFPAGEGLYTDMNAIRRDEEMDNLHSIYVDQWDWERVITPDERCVSFLQDIVRRIVDALMRTHEALRRGYPALTRTLCPDVSFITTQELEDLYPGLSPKAREDAYVRLHPTTFLMQIGGTLRSGIRHDGRAPDYDDWALNGDLLLWNPVLSRAFEISSMGIRVDPESLDRQLRESGCDGRRTLPFHRALLSGELPLTIGGGIGQSRVSMLLLEKAHIGEVQVSVWDDATVEGCRKAGIALL
ncbi:MAG: aspartate--ammonia ligase [Eubacteriales bacterium]|nr:aspartate--ammonia ligase [Clostridiales bacterium]MDY5014693.1 aspartate--ammonia ligase [Eubacteriales bacterium]